MVLGNLPVPGRPTNLITVGQRPIALAVGAGGGCLDFFTLLYPFSPLSPSLWETARYRLKYCLKGPLNPKQPTNQIILNQSSSQIGQSAKCHILIVWKRWCFLPEGQGHGVMAIFKTDGLCHHGQESFIFHRHGNFVVILF